MNKFIFLLLFLLCAALYSCDDSALPILKKELTGANKIKIYFYEDSTGRFSNLKMIDFITSKDSINNFLGYITEENFVNKNCLYSGMAEFYKNDSILMNMEFSLMNNCEHIIFKTRDIMQSKKLKPEGINFLINTGNKLKNKL